MLGYFAILPALSILLCISLGIFIIFRNPGHPTNIGFVLGMLSLVIIETGHALILLSDFKPALISSGIHITLVGEALLPVTWLIFSLNFARANHVDILHRWLPILVAMAVISFIFGILTTSPLFVSLPSSDDIEYIDIINTHFILGPFGRYFYIYLIIGLVLNLIQLENTLRSSEGIQRRHIKYVLFGVGAILAFSIYLSTQALLFSSLTAQTIPVFSAAVIISVSIIALFIVKNRLLDVDISISRYVIYNSLTVLIVGLYLLSVSIVTYGIKYFKTPFDYFFIPLFIFVSILSLVFLLFAEKLKRKVQLFIIRHFYRQKYEFRDKWMETIEKISSKRSVEEVYKTLIRMISDTMGVTEIFLWIYNPVTNDYYLTDSNLKIGHIRIENSHPIIQYIKFNMEPFSINALKNGEASSRENYREINALLTETGAELCSPLIAGNEIVGFLLQGKDIPGEPYRKDDFGFLKAVTTQAAVQIKNIRLIQELIASKEIESFHKMVSFIMHDLKNLTNSLSLVNQNAKYNMDNPEFQKDAMKTIEDTVFRMKELIERLSSLPRDIELKKESVELKGMVHKVLKKMPVSNNTKNVVVTEEIDDIPLVSIDPEAMEMVFINLLSNAYESIQRDGKIKVGASLNGTYVDIMISDNGIGMSKEFIEKSLFQPFKTTKKGSFGIGLYQCKAVIEAHNGKIKVDSEEGKGTIFTVKLPV